MKLKLTHSEFWALHDLLKAIADADAVKGLQMQMLHSILYDLWVKFYRAAVDKQKAKYGMKLKPHEAIGFWYFFEKYPFEPNQVFECNLVHSIRNSIHQKLCS